MLEKEIISPQRAAALVEEGMNIMIGGFMSVGTPGKIIDALVERGVGDGCPKHWRTLPAPASYFIL